jgi:hypothetical protein
MPKEEFKQQVEKELNGEGNSYFDPYRSQAHPSKLARTAVMRWPASSSVESLQEIAQHHELKVRGPTVNY